ncbi:hypothetical protein NDU88_003213 [Pleurodeles waltl]|uniref:Secreted protein n=1 Tax=Pleurodeles waltl TaxID=8319 RepID=A0AAV7WS77_PLEWA|nr:hypothetical protein NDU88_003213 [Pleurodeles waltl]
MQRKALRKLKAFLFCKAFFLIDFVPGVKLCLTKRVSLRPRAGVGKDKPVISAEPDCTLLGSSVPFCVHKRLLFAMHAA